MIRQTIGIAAASLAALLSFSAGANAKCGVPPFVDIKYPPVNEVLIDVSPNTSCAVPHSRWSFAAAGGLNVPSIG